MYGDEEYDRREAAERSWRLVLINARMQNLAQCIWTAAGLRKAYLSGWTDAVDKMHWGPGWD